MNYLYDWFYNYGNCILCDKKLDSKRIIFGDHYTCNECYVRLIGNKHCPHCNYRCKKQITLDNHVSKNHNEQCVLCLKFKNNVSNSVCEKCSGTFRVENKVSNFLDSNFGTEFLLGSDTSLKQLGGCSGYRPDKIYLDKEMALIVEVDENRHRAYKCEEKRMLDICSELLLVTKKVVIIRFSVKYEHKHGNETSDLTESKLNKLLDVMKKMKPGKETLKIYYMYYGNVKCSYPHQII